MTIKVYPEEDLPGVEEISTTVALVDPILRIEDTDKQVVTAIQLSAKTQPTRNDALTLSISLTLPQ